MSQVNSSCKLVKSSPTNNIKQDTKDPIKDYVKPFIIFGEHSDEVDVNFSNFDIRDNFKDYHFKNKQYNILPNITNADTILQFTLPYKKELENYTYLLLDIWGNESLWRVHSRQTIYYNNKMALQFDCKRDYFNEYFGLKKNPISLLQNVFVLRTNFLNASLENLKICSQACLNDTTPKQIKLSNSYNGKKLITSSTYNTIKLWEIRTTNYTLLREIIRDALNNFNFNFWNTIKSSFPTYSNLTDIYPSSNLLGSFSWDRYYVTVDNIFKRNYYTLYWTYKGSSISKSNLQSFGGKNDEIHIDTIRRYYGWNYSPISNIVGKDDKILGWKHGKYQYLIWDYKGKTYLNYSTTSIGGSSPVARIDWCKYLDAGENGYNKIQDLCVCGWDNKYPYCWYEASPWGMCGERTLTLKGSYSFKYLTYDTSEIKLIRVAQDNLPGGQIEMPSNINGTVYDGQEPSSVYIRSYEWSSKIDEISTKLNISKSTVRNAYNRAITTLFSTIKSKLGDSVIVREVEVRSGGINYGSSAIVYFNIYDNSGNAINKERLYDLDFVNSITLSTDPVYRKVNASNHYEATHIQDYLVGNSVGVFQVKREQDYLLKNRNSGEQVIFSSEIPELMETGTVTLITRDIKSIGASQLELDSKRAMLELQNKRDDETLKFKIDNLNRNNELTKRSVRDRNNLNQWGSLVNKLGSGAGAIAGGLVGGGIGAGAGGYLGGLITNNIFGNKMINYENELRDFQTKNNISDLINENDLNKKYRQEQFNLNSFFANNVSGHLVNVAERKFPWISSTRDIYQLRVAFGDKEKIQNERTIFGDFINQYYDIQEKDLLEKNFLQIDSSKSDIISFPGLDAIGNQLIIDLLNKGIFIHKPKDNQKSITRVW